MSWISNILPHLEQRFDIHCILRPPAPGEVQPDIPTTAISHAALLSPTRLFGQAAVAEVLDSFSPQVILISGFTGLLSLFMLRRLPRYRNIPVLMVQRGVLSEFPNISQWKLRLAAWLGRLALRPGDQLAAVAPNVQRYLRDVGFAAQGISLIPNGVDLQLPEEQAAPLNTDQRLHVAFIGRLSIEKGADRLPALVAAARGRQIVLHIAGAGDMAARLRQELAEDVDAGRVIFHGWLDEPARLLQKMDLLLLTSRTEACPHAVLEAFALGKPVWALSVGGLPYILDEGRAGRLFPDFESMRLAFSALDRTTLEAMSPQCAHGRLLLRDRYALSAMVNRYVEHLQSLIAQRA